MIRVRGLVIIVAAVAIAALAGTLLIRHNNRTAKNQIRLVVATRDIPPGTRLESDCLRLQTWPASSLPQGGVKHLKALSGQIAKDFIYKGEPIYKARLFLDKIPKFPKPQKPNRSDPAMRAVSLSIDSSSGLSGIIKPGDKVDVIVRDSFDNQDIARRVLSGVMVMDVEKTGTSSRSKRVAQQLVTLRVNSEQAGILALFKTQSLKLAKGNGTDLPDAEVEAVLFSAETGPETRAGITRKEQERMMEWDRQMDQGKRAVTISLSDLDGVCGFLRPGNRVDVMAVSFSGNISTEGSESGAKGTLLKTAKAAQIILQDLEVLEVQFLSGSESDFLIAGEKKAAGGSSTRAGNNYRSGAKGKGGIKKAKGARQHTQIGQVTLLASPRMAEKLVAACNSQYSIKLIVRNQSDREVIRTQGQKLVDVFWNNRKHYHSVEYLYGATEWGMTFDEDEIKAKRSSGKKSASTRTNESAGIGPRPQSAPGKEM